MATHYIQAGELVHLVTFDEPVSTQNSIGEEIITWTPSFTVWAAVEPLRGREQFLAGAVNAQLDTRIRVRWSPRGAAVNEKWRARVRDVIYGIESIVDVDSKRREVQIMASSMLSDVVIPPADDSVYVDADYVDADYV